MSEWRAVLAITSNLSVMGNQSKQTNKENMTVMESNVKVSVLNSSGYIEIFLNFYSVPCGAKNVRILRNGEFWEEWVKFHPKIKTNKQKRI